MLDPVNFIREPLRAQALADLKHYLAARTGAKFEDFADRVHPNHITERDIVALMTVSLDVPAEATIELFFERSAQVAKQLANLPTSDGLRHLWDAEDETGPAWELWRILRSIRGIGRTTASKLMAVKRPHLIPIYDDIVGGVLEIGDDENDWAEWQ